MPTGAGPSLEPYKLATIVLLTREMIDGSNAEAIVRQALLDSTAPALDASLFSNNAGTPGLQPPGLLNGVTPITASTSTNKTEAMDDDLAALVQAIAARAGNGSVAFVAAPAQATRILDAGERHARAGAHERIDRAQDRDRGRHRRARRRRRADGDRRQPLRHHPSR